MGSYNYIQPMGWYVVVNIFLRCCFKSLGPVMSPKAAIILDDRQAEASVLGHGMPWAVGQ